MFQHSHGAQQRLFDLWSCSGGAVQAVHFEYLKFTWSYTKRELIGGYWWYQSTWKISRTHEIAETCWNHQQNICWMQGRSCRNFAMQEFLILNVVQGWTLPKVRNISAQINGLGKDLVDRYDHEWSIRIDLSATVSDLSWDQLCQSWAQPCQHQWKQNIISAVSSASTMVQHIQPNTWKQRRRLKKKMPTPPTIPHVFRSFPELHLLNRSLLIGTILRPRDGCGPGWQLHPLASRQLREGNQRWWRPGRAFHHHHPFTLIGLQRHPQSDQKSDPRAVKLQTHSHVNGNSSWFHEIFHEIGDSKIEGEHYGLTWIHHWIFGVSYFQTNPCFQVRGKCGVLHDVPCGFSPKKLWNRRIKEH